MARKTFKITEGNNLEVELTVRTPQFEDFEESDKVYASRVASLVRDSGGRKKLLLRREIETFLKEQKIWTKDDEVNVRKLQDEIDSLLNTLRKGGIKLSEVRKLCLNVADKRSEMVKILSKRRIFDDTTIEALSESDRNDYLVYICTVYAKDGKNYWQSFDDMKNDKLSEAYRKASLAVYETVYGINTEFEKTLPENKLLMKFGFIDSELNFVDRKTGEFVDKEGNPVKQLNEDALTKMDSLNGDIVEESPFIDDETGSPVTDKVEVEVVKEDKKRKKKTPIAEEIATVE